MFRNSNNSAPNVFKRRSNRYIISFLVLIMLFFSLDWLSLFLYKFLKNHRTAFWVAICIHVSLIVVVTMKYKSIFKKVKLWFYKNDESAIPKNSNDYYFYFKKD